jgi:hypothetical protein
VSSISSPNFWIILLLGSYDPKTEKLMQNLKEKMSEHFMNLNETLLIFLLSNLELYVAEITPKDQIERLKVMVISELFEQEKRMGIYIVNEGSVLYAIDAEFDPSSSQEEFVRAILENEFVVDDFFKPPILTELEHISKMTTLTFVIRDRELTRGGEYIELVYLLDNAFLDPQRTFFVKREGFSVSSMAWEILDFHNVQFRTYRKEQDLHSEAIRIFSHYLERVYSK